MQARNTRQGMSIACMGALVGLLALGPAVALGQEAPKDVLILGDSIMQAVARSFERQLGRHAGFQAASFTRIGSGLARLDVFDWHVRIEQLVAERQPGLVLVMMGANDNQPMQTDGNEVVQTRTAAWETEYGARIGRAMDILLEGGATQIHWLELPDVRDTHLQQDIESINQLIRTEAAARPQVTFQETRSVLSRTPGTYTAYVIQANGMPLNIRDRDGIHLNRAGADLLVTEMLARIWGL